VSARSHRPAQTPTRLAYPEDAHREDVVGSDLSVTINVQGVVLLAGGAAVVALAIWRQWRRVRASSGG
jgi:hypothetical protein